ncbi:hypothetical protein [uncultured Gammaproteobacteria bacterium]|nr:hypothetical protein [uncultured Gammaproteobacteria bacterium]
MDKNLHIPQGYRQTEVGVIPDDWEVVKLNEKAFIQRGKFSPRPRNNPKYYHGKYPFVQTSDVVNSKGKITSYSQTLNDKGLAVSKLFPYGTILMTVAANIGFTGILARDMACPDSLVGIQCKKSLYNKFLNFYFIYNQKKIDYLAEEAAQKNINLSILNNLRIPMPPKQEQQKIADILTTWDNAINQQTTLIEKKQQLLTAKTRFSEFSDDWKIEKLKDVFNFKKGSGLSKGKIVSSGDFDCVLYGELYTIYNEIITTIKSKTNAKEGFLSQYDDILIPASTTTSAIDLAIASVIKKMVYY